MNAEGGTRTRTPCGATPSRWCVCQFHHFGEVLLLFRCSRWRWCGRRRWRSWCRRRCLLLRRGLLLLRLILRFGALMNNGGTAGRRNQNGQRERCDHKEDRGCCGGSAQNRSSAAGAKRGLTAAATESPRPIRAFSLLQKHNENQKNANDNVKDRQQSDHIFFNGCALSGLHSQPLMFLMAAPYRACIRSRSCF